MEKQPHRISGRQVYVQSLMELAEDWKRAGKKGVGPGVHKSIMKGHGQAWAKMQPGRKQEYMQRAALARSKREKHLREELDEETQRL
eukprot:3195553-Lingulodinium_polyedra.AAC.1